MSSVEELPDALEPLEPLGPPAEPPPLEPIPPPPSGPTPREKARSVIVDVLVRRVHTLAALDAAVFLRINGWYHNAVSDRFMSTISRLMLHGELWVAAMLVAAIVDPSNRRELILVALPVMGLATLTVNYLLKPRFRRRRPFIHIVETVVVGRRPEDTSFPSGHTAAAFSGAWLLAAAYPTLGPWFYLVAIVVGITRVYLGVHFPTDVILGGLAGMALAIAYSAFIAMLVL